MNSTINLSEKGKKIAIIGVVVFILVGVVLTGRLIRERADIRNRAAGPPICSLESSCSVDPQYAGGNFVIKVYEGTTVVAAGNAGETSVTFTANPLGTYRCEIEDPNNSSCKEVSQEVVAPICLNPSGTPTPSPTETGTPTPTPTGTLTPTPTDDPGSQIGGVCQDCTQIKIEASYLSPTPFEMNVQNELYIGRLFIDPSLCTSPFSCASVERFYIAAASGPACPNPNDNSSIMTFDPPSRGELDPDQSQAPTACELAMDNYPNEDPAITPPGAPFRLHQARGADCRYYQPRLEFKLTPTVVPEGICTDCFTVCCPQRCLQPQIINVPEDFTDDCYGDPSAPTPTPGGPTPVPNTECYFDLTEPNACPNLNELAYFQTRMGPVHSTGDIEFDDDFRQSSFSVNPNVDNPTFTYQDAGVYDVVLSCGAGDTARSCKKRMYVTCNAGNDCPAITYVTPPICR